MHVVLIALALGGCTASAPKSSPSGAQAEAGQLAPGTEIATLDGKPVTYAELVSDKEMGGQFKQAESKALAELYDVRKKAADQLLTRRLLSAEAKKANKELDDWFQHDFLASVPEATDAEVNAAFEEHKSQLPPNAKLEELKPKIAQFVKQENAKKHLASMLEDLKAKRKAKVTLVAPQLPRVEVAATGPSKGPSNAKVTIVEFSDFQCPFCSRAAPTIDRVMKDYDGKVRLVFRHFPLDFHPMVAKAAEAGACAADQGKFWQMHDKMFGNQQKLAVADLKASAKEIGLDTGKFDKCLDSGEKKSAVQNDQKAGSDAGVNGTPAFFVNGVFINGAVPYEEFKAALDRELGKG
ncbi:MAG: thioredoxin domain-containing protein [Myxococcales bacterium]